MGPHYILIGSGSVSAPVSILESTPIDRSGYIFLGSKLAVKCMDLGLNGSKSITISQISSLERSLSSPFM